MQGWALGLALGCVSGAPDPVMTVVSVRSPAPTPGWLTGPVAFDRPYAGVGRKQHALCRGTDGAREALLTALDDESLGPAVLDAGLVDGGCADPSWTPWLKAQLRAPDPLGLRSPLGWALVADPDPAVGAWLLDEGPDAAAVAWLTEHGRELPPRAVPMLGRLLREHPGVAVTGVSWLATLDDPAAEQALLTLHEHAPPELRDEIAASLYGRGSEAAQRIHAAYCADAEDARCGWGRLDPLEGLRGCVAPGSGCADEDVAAAVAAAAAYRSAAADLLAPCAGSAEGPQRACARALVALDPARAAAALSEGDEAVADLRADLARTPAERARAVEALGLSGAPADAATVHEALAAGGWAVPVGAVRADRLLYTLAEAVAATGEARAAGVAFELAGPSWTAPEVAGRVPRDALSAYADGWRTRVLLAPDRSAVPAVAGLLNAVLAARGADRRVAVDVDEAFFVIGAPDALRGLAEGGLVRFAPPPAPQDVSLPLPSEAE